MVVIASPTDEFEGQPLSDFLRPRYYDPGTGKFNKLDPFAGNYEDPQSLHKYAYVHGDPINGIDPTGQFFETIARIVAYSISAIVGYFIVSGHKTDVANRNDGGIELDLPRQLLVDKAMAYVNQQQALGVEYHGTSHGGLSHAFTSSPLQPKIQYNPNRNDVYGYVMGSDIVLTDSALGLDPRLLAAVIVHEYEHVRQDHGTTRNATYSPEWFYERPAYRREGKFMESLGIRGNLKNIREDKQWSELDKLYLGDYAKNAKEFGVENPPIFYY